MKRRIEIEVDVKVTAWTVVEGRPGWEDTNMRAVRIWFASDGRRYWACHQWEYLSGNGERWEEAWWQSPVQRFPSNAYDPEPGDEMPSWTK